MAGGQGPLAPPPSHSTAGKEQDENSVSSKLVKALPATLKFPLVLALTVLVYKMESLTVCSDPDSPPPPAPPFHLAHHAQQPHVPWTGLGDVQSRKQHQLY